LATVSVWTTKSAATTAKTQGQLETYCKNVALAIKKVLLPSLPALSPFLGSSYDYSHRPRVCATVFPLGFLLCDHHHAALVLRQPASRAHVFIYNIYIYMYINMDIYMQVIGAADQLRLMQEQEEEGLIEEEAEELARLVMDKTVQVRGGSAVCVCVCARARVCVCVCVRVREIWPGWWSSLRTHMATPPEDLMASPYLGSLLYLH
jgi:hypothetical protein